MNKSNEKSTLDTITMLNSQRVLKPNYYYKFKEPEPVNKTK